MTKNQTSYKLPFILVSSLFFLWGIANNLNGILIPHLRKALQLTNMQSTFVDTAVYFAYFITAIPAGLILKRFGYKKGIITGLVVFSIGAFLFIPAANLRAYNIFLFGLFIIGCGLTILETAANPYASKLGDPETATSRLTLAQSFNGLAVFIAPVIGTIFILSGKEFSSTDLAAMSDADKLSYLSSEAASVKMPYLSLGIFLLAIAVLFLVNNFPELKEEEDDNQEKGSLSSAIKHKHLVWAVIAQFFYVGAQVCVTSFFIRMAIAGGGVDEKTAGYYLSVYGILFMIGRFAGSAIMRYVAPQKLLSLYAAVCILLSFVAIKTDGQYVVVALGGLGFFMSIMFPTIFALGINGMKSNTKPARFGDDIQIGYIVPMLCYVFVLYFGIKGYKPSSQS
ncbi:MAG: L-fucose:H+ symporter permease [Chitinophagia bacterium]|nr:L-fucose:H+ symporter permease [Chitinophagia bacterium]